MINEKYIFSVDHLYKKPDENDCRVCILNTPQCYYHFRCEGHDLFIRRVRSSYEVFSDYNISIPPVHRLQRYRNNEIEYIFYKGTDFKKALFIYTKCVKYLTNLLLPDITKS